MLNIMDSYNNQNKYFRYTNLKERNPPYNINKNLLLNLKYTKDISQKLNPGLEPVFYKKYLLYKKKYLELKKQLGGRNVNVYDKKNSELKYNVQLELDDDIYTFKNQVLNSIGDKNLNVDDIDVYAFRANRCVIPKLNDIKSNVTDICIDITKKQDPKTLIPKNLKTGLDSFETPLDGQEGIFQIGPNAYFKGKVEKGTRYPDQISNLERAFGSIFVTDGPVFSGIFINNVLEGPGKITYPDGAIYTGFFSGNLLNGKGKIIVPAINEVVEGNFVDNKLNGQGKITNPRETITGEFINGDFVSGQIKDKEGNIFKGTFKNYILDGEGEKIYTDGYSSKVTYVKGKLQGYGKITYSFGDTLEGNFTEGMLNGLIKITNATGMKEETQYVNDLKNGKSKKIYPDGMIEEINYVNDVIHGKYKITYPDGTVEEKDYENGYEK